MVCVKCGTTIPDDVVACPKCGASVEPPPDTSSTQPRPPAGAPIHRSYVPLWASCILLLFLFGVAGAAFLGWALWQRGAVRRPPRTVAAQGGVRMALRCQTERMPAGVRWDASMLETTRQVLERRAAMELPAGTIVRAVPPDTLVVEVPGQAADPDKVRAVIGSTAKLEFRYVPELDRDGEWSTRPEKRKTATGEEDTGFETIVDRDGRPVSAEELQTRVFDKEPIASSAQLKPNCRADVVNGQAIIHFEFQDEAKITFEEFTRGHVGKSLAIFLDHRLITAPSIEGAIPGQGILEGRFTPDAARTLANQLNAGALPVPVEVVTVEQRRAGGVR